MPRRDLSLAEQANIRALLNVLRVKLGGANWRNVERALPISHSMLAEILAGRAEISTTIAYRVAKALDVSLQEAITGEAGAAGDVPALRASERRLIGRRASDSGRATGPLLGPGQPPLTGETR